MSMAQESRPKLGRGLAALLGSPQPGHDAAEAPIPVAHRQRRVPTEHLRPNPRNPRKSFAEEELADLANSIKSRGVLQPVVVRAVANEAERFEIVAGERRWRAAQRAGVHDLPVVVVEADDRLALELAIIENVQRADLNAAEEARGYKHLIAEYNYSQAELGQVIGKSRSHVANTLRLLALPPKALEFLESGAISAGHARALLALPDPEIVADQIVARNLSVRDVEKMASKTASLKEPALSANAPRAPDADMKALSTALTQQTGLRISVERRGEGGRIIIDYQSLEQFDHIHRKLGEM